MTDLTLLCSPLLQAITDFEWANLIRWIAPPSVAPRKEKRFGM